MSMKEASYIIKTKEDEFINEWNKTRYICYSVIQSQSTSKLKLTDIIKFPWEQEEEEEEQLQIKTKDELIKHALEMEKRMNNING